MRQATVKPYRRCGCKGICDHPYHIKLKRKWLPGGQARHSLEDWATWRRGTFTPVRTFGTAVRIANEFVVWVDKDYGKSYAEWRQVGPASTVAQVYEKYVELHVKPHRILWTSSHSYPLRALVQKYGRMPIKDVTLVHIEELFKEWRHLAAGTQKLRATKLKAFFNWASHRSRGYIDEVPFTVRDLNIPPAGGRSRLPTEDEEARIWDLVNSKYPFVRDVLHVALATALRKSSIRRLQMKHVRLDSGKYGALVLPASANKDKETITVWLTPLSRAAIERRMLAYPDLTPETYLFGDSKGECYSESYFRLDYEWRAIKRELGLTFGAGDPNALHWHDLRAESAVRLLVQTGGRLDLVQRQLGHSSLTTTTRYIRQRATDADVVADAMTRAEKGTGTGTSEEAPVSPNVVNFKTA